MDVSSDAELLERVQRGDEQAWKMLVERHSGRLWAVVRAQGLDRELAADVIQTVWLNLLHGAGSIRNPDALGGWLGTVARHEAIRVGKRTRRAVPTGDETFDRMPVTAPDHDANVILGEDQRIVRQAMRHLGEKCRELLTLLFSSDEVAYTDVAEMLDMPIGSIGPTRARCLDKLRHHAIAEGVTP